MKYTTIAFVLVLCLVGSLSVVYDADGGRFFNRNRRCDRDSQRGGPRIPMPVEVPFPFDTELLIPEFRLPDNEAADVVTPPGVIDEPALSIPSHPMPGSTDSNHEAVVAYLTKILQGQQQAADERAESRVQLAKLVSIHVDDIDKSIRRALHEFKSGNFRNSRYIR